MTGVPHETGQWLEATDGGRWWFDSGSLALDFAYTGALDTGNPAWERLRSAADLSQWIGDRFPGIDTVLRESDRTDALALRSAIARLALRASLRPGSEGDMTTARGSAADIDVLNLFAATPDIPPALAGGSRQAGRTRASARQALSTVARDAVGLFGPEGGGRIRACSADDCAIIYLDTSRSGSRRWCSMQRCGNRAKVRAHRARAAEHP